MQSSGKELAMDAMGYTVQKLTRQYCVTRLATAGDESLAEDLRVETTPLPTLANAILDDCGMASHPQVAQAFATRFLHPLSALSAGVVTISTTQIRNWASAESATAQA
jgi:hypothetical protein